jgi:hypothetical protein
MKTLKTGKFELVRTGVTKGTGQVGNTFAEVEIKRAWSLRESSIFSQEKTLRAAEKFCFVSGHDFSRAVNDCKYFGL